MLILNEGEIIFLPINIVSFEICKNLIFLVIPDMPLYMPFLLYFFF